MNLRSLEDLYSVPPAEFVRARNAYAARLRENARSPEARAVQRLRRPTPAVWAINRVAREHREGVTRLLQAVDRLRRAHLGTGGTLAEATQEQREAFDRLLKLARESLKRAGLANSTQIANRMQATLLGAAADPKRRKELQAGRLTTELQAPGFEWFSGRAGAARRLPTRRPAASTKRVPARAAERAPTGEERQRAKALQREAQRQARESEQHVQQLERLATRERRAAEVGERTIAQLRRRLAELEDQVAERRAAADAAARDAERARRASAAGDRARQGCNEMSSDSAERPVPLVEDPRAASPQEARRAILRRRGDIEVARAKCIFTCEQERAREKGRD